MTSYITKNKILSKPDLLKHKKGFGLLGVLLFFSLYLKAQFIVPNVTYNVNSIPNNVGHSNTVFGIQSLTSNTSGVGNSAIGSNVLTNNTTGICNVGLGVQALYLNNTGRYNVALGSASLSKNTNGSFNIAIGPDAAWQNTTGGNNIAVGRGALSLNFTGSNNIGLGRNAGVSVDGLNNSIAIGANAIVNISNSIQLGDANVTTVYAGTGTNAKLISGGLQVTGGALSAGKILTSDALGNATWQAPGSVGGGTFWNLFGNSGTVDGTNFIGTSDNVPFNIKANNTNAARLDPTLKNAFFGVLAGTNNTTGDNNSMFGNNANTISGSLTNATAIGANAIVNSSNSIQMGDANVRLVYAGVGNTAKLITGRLQVSSGSLTAGNVLTSDGLGNAVWQTPGGGGLSNGWGLTGNAGTVDGINFIGTTDFVPLNFRVNNDIAGKIDPQYQNVLLGYKAGENFNTSSFNNNAIQNVAIGDQALYSNQNSFGNTAVGFNALYSIVGSTTSVSSGNVALGWKSLFNTRFGQDNTALGTLALYNNINSEYNTAIGKSALLLNTIGERNTGVGGWSLSNNNDGITNSGLGFRTDVAVGNLNNATSIGSYAIVNASNKIRFGDPTVNVVEGPVVYTVSDGRFKNNINETDVKGLEFIKKLRPVVYNFDTRAFESFLTQAMPDSVRNKYMDKDFTKSTAIRQSGFIAQEVEKAASDVGYDFNGVHTPENKNDNYSLSYAQFVVPLVKAVQELSTQNTTLREELAELKLMVKESLISNKSKSLNGSIKITEGEDANIAKLFQNAPNPFSQNTTIKYSIPSTAKNATLTITTLLGKQVKAYALKNNSATSVEINGGQLTAGSYIYSLIVDGTLIDSKQMILTSK